MLKLIDSEELLLKCSYAYFEVFCSLMSYTEQCNLTVIFCFPLPDCQRFYWPPRLHPCLTRRSHRSRETNSVERQRKIRIPFSGELTNCCNSEHLISCYLFIIGNSYLFLLSVSTFHKIHENWWYDNSFCINFVDFDKMALPDRTRQSN